MTVIRKSMVFRAPIGMVWDHLTESDKIAQWLMPNDFQPVQGHDFAMQCDPALGSGGQILSTVREIEAPHRLVYSWVIDTPPLETLVSIELAEDPGGTRITLEHSGWEGLSDADRPILERHDMGWDHLLGTALRGLLEG